MKQSWKKLEDYLLNISPKEVLCWENNKSYVDMSWIFTKPLDEKIIQKALSNIMQSKNPTYTNTCERRGIKPEDIPGFYIIKNNDRILLGAPGNDGWTKVNITDRLVDGDNKQGKIPVITFDDLIKEVQNIISNNREVTKQEADFLIMGIKSAFSQSFENFVDYYQYLLKEKQESEKHKCVIQPRQDTGRKHTGGSGIPASERKNPIIDFIERDEFLKSKNPYTSVEVEEILKDGTIIPNSYTVYVYNDLLEEAEPKPNGYLFICEPLGGNRMTRLMYVSKEDFENVDVRKSEDRFGKVVKKYLDMSETEFGKEKGTAVLKHTALESYKERIEFFKDGKKISLNFERCKERLKDLYQQDEITFVYSKTKQDIAKIGENVNYSEIDRTAQTKIIKDDNTKENNKDEVVE